jgi:peptide/nickel transport system ATP-binding protein
MALLKADAIGVRIGGTPALEGVSFSLSKGQRLGIIGETGAGKSLLLLAIAGLLPPEAAAAGALLLDEAPMPVDDARAALRGKRIGVLLQRAGDSLDPLLRVGEQIAEALVIPAQPIAPPLPPEALPIPPMPPVASPPPPPPAEVEMLPWHDASLDALNPDFIGPLQPPKPPAPPIVELIGPVLPTSAAVPAPPLADLPPPPPEPLPLPPIAPTLNPAAATIEQLLRDVGLDPVIAGRYPRELSYGERQRAMLAAALAGGPELLLADDPTAGLDPIEQRAVVALIEKLCTEKQMALIFTSPDLKLVALLANRVLVLQDGKAIESGDKADVFGHPRQKHTRLLMTAGRHRAKTLMRTPIGAVLLDVRNVGRIYRDTSAWPRVQQTVAVENASLSIRQAESLALIGPNGAGKSTLARIIAGLAPATSGELEFDHAVYHGDDLPLLQRGGIGFVFPDPRLSFNPRLTVGESIAEPLQLESQRLMDELSARIVEMLGAIGMSPDVLGRLPGEFSLAELQRLALARALITRPRLIVFDDPVSVLDVGARGAFAVMLNRLRADFGLTFLIVSPDFELVRVVADRVLVMDHGRIVETGTPATLLDRPQQPTTQRLVSAALPDVGIVPVF